MTQVLRRLLFEVEPTDPGVFGIVVVAVVLATMFVSYLPARRAARVDPVVALNND